MKSSILGLCACLWATVVSAAVTYNDSTEDIDAGLSDGNGTLDIVSVEVSHTATDVIFALTVDGNVSSDDWGTFMIGIATGGAGTTNSAGWSRPIYLDSPIGGMNYWIGSRVDSGGEAQLWSYNGMGWNFTGALTAFSFTPGAQSLVIFTVAQADVGLSSGDRFYFDVYASGGLDTDSAVDALSNPNVSIWEWTQAYTSRTNDTGLSDYTLAVTADVVPSQGPFAGGNMVVVTNAVPAIGDGSDITNVTMGGVAATLAGQGANWVSFVAPATDSAGAKDIVIQSASLGDITFAGAYTVNPAGQIGGTQYGPCAWTNLGSGMNDQVYALAHDGTDLYAGGYFTNAGGVAANRVAKWDSASGTWTNLGSGMDYEVVALAHDGTDLYAGGGFWTAGEVAANRVAKWDPASGTWTHLGSGMENGVLALAHDGTDLYAAGWFTNAGGVAANRVAKWDSAGGTWTNLGSGMEYVVKALAHDGTDLYAGGRFTTADGVAANYVAKWGPTTIDFGGVAPPSGSSTGGFPVVISGTNLCDGTIGDVTNVTLCGVAATVTGVSGSTQIVVTAGTAAGAILGDVRVFSTSFGQTVKSNAFEYLRQQQASLVFNPVSPQAYLTTNALAVSGGAGTGAVSFLVLSGPGTLVDDTNLAVTASSGTIEIRATKAQDDLYEEASVTGTVTATKADQIIADFLPADGSTFVETNTVELSATASSGLEVTFTVLSGPGAIQDGTNLTFTGYGQVSLAARQEGNDNWNAASEVVHTCTVLGIFTITVESPYGTATPAAGAYEWVQGTVFTNQIETPDTQGSTQYVCNGWMATENLDPIGGVGTQAVVTVNGDGTMSWLWTTNYWLETAAAHGSVNVAAGWQPGGETTQITATPEPYYAFSLWFGDTSGDENPLDLLMDGPKSVTAYFTALMTSNRPTPLWWLADHGITEAFEAAVDGDPDEDSVPTGDEWVMDTDPTNGASFLAFDAVWPLYGSNCWDVVWTNEEPPYEIVTNLECEVIGHVFQWRASTSRVYTVQWSPIPIGPLSWSDVVGMRRLHPAASSLTVTNGAAGGERGLYRIRVNLPVE